MNYDELIDAIVMVVDKYVGSAPYNSITEGIIVDIDNSGKLYSVEINHVTYEKVPPADFNSAFSIGDHVYVIIMNNNFSHKLILGKNGNSTSRGKLDYFNLPTTPVRIIRLGNDPNGQAYRFDYAFENQPKEYAWRQVLHRNDEGKVYMISQYYSDDTILYFYLLRNSANKIEYYGENSKWVPTP